MPVWPRYDDLLEMLDDVSAAAENMLSVCPMTPADKAQRTRIITEARDLCNRLLREEDADN